MGTGQWVQCGDSGAIGVRAATKGSQGSPSTPPTLVPALPFCPALSLSQSTIDPHHSLCRGAFPEVQRGVRLRMMEEVAVGAEGHVSRLRELLPEGLVHQQPLPVHALLRRGHRPGLGPFPIGHSGCPMGPSPHLARARDKGPIGWPGDARGGGHEVVGFLSGSAKVQLPRRSQAVTRLWDHPDSDENAIEMTQSHVHNTTVMGGNGSPK